MHTYFTLQSNESTWKYISVSGLLYFYLHCLATSETITGIQARDGKVDASTIIFRCDSISPRQLSVTVFKIVDGFLSVRTDQCLTCCRLTGRKQLVVQGHTDISKHFLLFSICVQLKRERPNQTNKPGIRLETELLAHKSNVLIQMICKSLLGKIRVTQHHKTASELSRHTKMFAWPTLICFVSY